MKIITRKQLIEITEDVAYSVYTKGDFPDRVFIKYSTEEDVSHNTWVYEEFPITSVDLGGCDHWEDYDKFAALPVNTNVVVSDLSTAGEGFLKAKGWKFGDEGARIYIDSLYRSGEFRGLLDLIVEGKLEFKS